jgi:membrane-associated protease RseP (regulator of RpoE activity)
MPWSIVMLGLMGAGWFCLADDRQQQQQSQPQRQNQQGQPQAQSQQQQGQQRQGQQGQQQGNMAYLGVGVEAIPDSMRSHLQEALPQGQGVLVEQVAKDSPASRAGLRPHDVILTFNGQPITSPEQLVTAVHSAQPGQATTITYLRGGKQASCKATLGEKQSSLELPPRDQVYRFHPDEQFERFFFEQSQGRDGEHGWSSFESMKLSKLEDHRWNAEIEFRNKDGKKETKKFTGTRDEIRKQIQGEKDMPREEQEHLLRALNMHSPIFEFHFPTAGFTAPNSQQP